MRDWVLPLRTHWKETRGRVWAPSPQNPPEEGQSRDLGCWREAWGWRESPTKRKTAVRAQIHPREPMEADQCPELICCLNESHCLLSRAAGELFVLFTTSAVFHHQQSAGHIQTAQQKWLLPELGTTDAPSPDCYTWQRTLISHTQLLRSKGKGILHQRNGGAEGRTTHLCFRWNCKLWTLAILYLQATCGTARQPRSLTNFSLSLMSLFCQLESSDP